MDPDATLRTVLEQAAVRRLVPATDQVQLVAAGEAPDDETTLEAV